MNIARPFDLFLFLLFYILTEAFHLIINVIQFGLPDDF